MAGQLAIASQRRARPGRASARGQRSRGGEEYGTLTLEFCDTQLRRFPNCLAGTGRLGAIMSPRRRNRSTCRLSAATMPDPKIY